MVKKNMAVKRVMISLCLMIAFVLVVNVYAGQAYLQFSVPAFQGWFYTDIDSGSGYITGSSATKATIYGESMTNDAITFYAGHYNSNTEEYIYYSKGYTLENVDPAYNDFEVDVNYGATYKKGQLMGLKVRNHNWTLTKGTFAGVADYH